ncbi:hypothetical protein TWF481_010900 [Arthrobotrys musiformis]|uniref:Uncharacterized protein n=1 Tax=Arthrobotrys musiformis TaxID=47236 RepID=A0AAV9W2U5_9PEZI
MEWESEGDAEIENNNSRYELLLEADLENLFKPSKSRPPEPSGFQGHGNLKNKAETLDGEGNKVPELDSNPKIFERKNQLGRSPLAPVGSRRAYQGNALRANRLVSKTVPQPCPKPRGKISPQERQRRLGYLPERMTTSVYEDLRSRSILFRQLRQKMILPPQVSDCFKRLVENAWKISNLEMRDRLEQYSFTDMCDMWRLQNLKPQEYIYHLGWKGTRLDEPEVIKYLVLIGKQSAAEPEPESAPESEPEVEPELSPGK